MAFSPVPNVGQSQVWIRRMKDCKERNAINYQTLIDRLILQINNKTASQGYTLKKKIQQRKSSKTKYVHLFPNRHLI
jgi:hypothetical protein